MIKYIIVDDESAAHRVLKDYASGLSFMSLEKNCYNAMEAISFLNENQVDLIFLDINMPKLSGFDMLKTLKNRPKIIVTTAHQEYALEGYELEIIDYLLKPFSFDRFIKAVNKVQAQQIPIKIENSNNQLLASDSIFIKDSKKHWQIKFKDILFVEAKGNYVKINTVNSSFMTYNSLSSIEQQLPKSQFIKTHKSFIVSKPHIKNIEGNTIAIKDYTIPIGKLYKRQVLSLLNSTS